MTPPPWSWTLPEPGFHAPVGGLEHPHLSAEHGVGGPLHLLEHLAQLTTTHRLSQPDPLTQHGRTCIGLDTVRGYARAGSPTSRCRCAGTQITSRTSSAACGASKGK